MVAAGLNADTLTHLNDDAFGCIEAEWVNLDNNRAILRCFIFVITFCAPGPVCGTGRVWRTLPGTVARAICIACTASEYIAIVTGFKLGTGFVITAGGAATSGGAISIAGTTSIGIAVVAGFSCFNHAIATGGCTVVVFVSTATDSAACIVAVTRGDGFDAA